MIYDCFIFNNELDILDVRFHELSDVVDKFVLVEATVTHTNKKKPLYFGENKHRFSAYRDKIIHIPVKDMPDVNLAWILNDFHFSQICRGLKKCKANDIILFGDVDEIPKAESLLSATIDDKKLYVFEQRMSSYYLNCIEYAKGKWYGTRAARYRKFKTYGSAWIAKFSKVNSIIADGGWHFSWIGDVGRIREKMSVIAHQEYNNDQYNTPEKIKKAILGKKDLFNLGYKFKVVSTESLPLYVQKNKELFVDILLDPGEKTFVNLTMLNYYLTVKNMMRIWYRKIRKITKVDLHDVK